MKFKTLEDVQKYLNKIPHINEGGCGFSALAMYEWLKKNKQLKDTKIVYLNSYRMEYPDAPAHAVLFHDGEYIDSTGNVSIHSYGWNKYTMTKRDVKISLEDGEDWNQSFNRDKYVQKIEKTLGVKLWK